MNFRNLSHLVGATVLILGIAACGGGKSTTTQAESAATTAPTTEAQRETAALPLAKAAPVDVKCGAVMPVWVNMHTKAYHTSSDPYYGKTKNGKYMCPSQAVAQGYHAAGMHHKGMKGGKMSNGMEMESPSAESTP